MTATAELAGIASDVLGDRMFRIVPMTSADAHEMVRSVRAAPLLFGYRGRPAVDVAAVEDVLLRIGQLAADVAEITELDLNPMIAGPEGVVVVDAKVRLFPVTEQADPLLRRLRDKGRH